MGSVKTGIHITLLLAVCAAGRADITFRWRNGTEMPSARDYLGCAVVNDLFVVAGGAYWKDDKKCYSSETIAYDPVTAKWLRLPDLPGPGAYGACAAIRDSQGNDQLLIAGGTNDKGVVSACSRLVKTGNTSRWEPLPDLPRPLAGAAGAAVGDVFYIFGGAPGMDEASIRSARPVLLELELSGTHRSKLRWRERHVAGAPSARIGAAVAACGNRLFVFGGYGVQPDGRLGNFSDAYMLDPSEASDLSWKRIRDMPIPSRWTTAVALDDRSVGLFGGYGGGRAEGFLDAVFLYDVEHDIYTPCGCLPKPMAVMASGLNKNEFVYLAGGEDKQRHRSAGLLIGRLETKPP